jgi:hypothetical protein
MRTAILAAMAMVALSSNPFTHPVIPARCHTAAPPVTSPRWPDATGGASGEDAPQSSAVMLRRLEMWPALLPVR